MCPNGSQIDDFGQVWAKDEADDFGLISARKKPRILVQVKARCCKRPAQLTSPPQCRRFGEWKNGAVIFRLVLFTVLRFTESRATARVCTVTRTVLYGKKLDFGGKNE